MTEIINTTIDIPYFDLYIDYMEIELGRSASTIRSYSYDLNQFFEFLLDDSQQAIDVESMSQISQIDIRRFMTYLRRVRKNANSSIARRIVSLRSYFDFLIKTDLLDKNPAEDIDTPKSKKTLPKFLSEEDINKLLKSLGEYRGLYEVMYSTGCRVSEIANMNTEDLDLPNREITVRDGKGGKDRVVMLTNRAKRHLEHYLNDTRKHIVSKMGDNHPDLDAVFLSSQSQRISVRTIQHKIKKAAEKLGLEVTPHKFRHSLASHLVMKNTNIRVVQDLLGHEDLSTTQIYTNVTDRFKRAEFDRNMGIK